jgi:uncharacterized protein
MRAVIDTNCLIAAIPRHRKEYWLYRAFENKAFDWVLSNEILLEYTEILSNFYNPTLAELVVTILLTADNVILTEPFYHWNYIEADPDDNKFVDIAVAGNADFIVSNDKHFRILKEKDFPTFQVVDLEAFRIILGY